MDTVKEYVASSQLQTRDNNDVVDEFEVEISQMHGKCIDIGCGPGVFTRQYLLPKLPTDVTIVGCDISRKMIDYAKTTNADERRLSFMELDIQAEYLPPNQIGSYDNALSFYCLHWCQNIRKVFENIYQLLRPGGKCLVVFLANSTLYNAVIRLQENPKYAPYLKDASKYISLFRRCKNSRIKLRTILKECSFQIIHCSVRDKTFEFENLDSLDDFAQSLNPFSKQMPVDMRDEFNNYFRDVLSETHTFLYPPDQQRKLIDVYQILIAYVKKS